MHIIFLIFVALICVGPKKLPALAAKAGVLLGKLQLAKSEMLAQLTLEIGDAKKQPSPALNEAHEASGGSTTIKPASSLEDGMFAQGGMTR